MDGNLPGPAVHGIFQARILEWAAIFFSRGSSQPRDRIHISGIGRWILYHWASGKAQEGEWSMVNKNLFALLNYSCGFPGGSDGKASVCNAGDPGSIPGLGRSPGEENGSPLQDYCLENLMDGGAWWAIVHRVTKSWTWLKQLNMHPHTHTHTHAEFYQRQTWKSFYRLLKNLWDWIC